MACRLVIDDTINDPIKMIARGKYGALKKILIAAQETPGTKIGTPFRSFRIGFGVIAMRCWTLHASLRAIASKS